LAADVTREQFEARVGVLEREVEGEKLVTRHILEQTRRNADDLAALRSGLVRVERTVEAVAQDVGSQRRTLEGLVRDLPKIIGDAFCSASRTRGGK
jgi:hypothetical protein